MREMNGCLAVIFGMFMMVAILAVLLALPTMLLWNAFVPDITRNAVTELTFWQALGLNFLCGILFRGSSVSSSSKD